MALPKIVLTATVAFAAAAATAQDDAPWRLVYASGREGEFEQYTSVKMDGKDGRRESEGRNALGGWSPDGKRKVYVYLPGGTSQIRTTDPEESKRENLTDGKSLDLSPSWTSDGKRIVFQSNRSGKPQVWIMDADGKNPIQLTDHRDGATLPAASLTGDMIAYREEHPAREKLPPSTLRTMDLSGRNQKVLIEKTQMLGHAWSPKGELAVSLVNELRILEVPSGKKLKNFTFEEIHKDLYAHAAYGVMWRPDGKAVACTIQFLGGRTEGAKAFGDTQVFILPLEGKPVVIDSDSYAYPVRWTR